MHVCVQVSMYTMFVHIACMHVCSHNIVCTVQNPLHLCWTVTLAVSSSFFFRSIIVETRPVTDPDSPSNLYVLVSDES